MVNWNLCFSGTVMRMMKDKVPFIVTDDIEQLVMPRIDLKNTVTIKVGDNDVIAGLETKESENEDVFGQGNVDSREDEFMTNQGHDEFLDRNEEVVDDDRDQESMEEENDTDFVDEELEQMREPEMKRGQIGGSLNRNRGRNSHKNARFQDEFDDTDNKENNNAEDEFDEFGNRNEDFVDEEQMREPEMKRGQIGGSLNRNRGRNSHKNARFQDEFDDTDNKENNNAEDEFDEFGNRNEDFVDEELEQMHEPEMKRGQIGGSLNGNRGRNSHKNARVHDAFGNLDGEADLDGLENEKEDFEDGQDEFMEKDVAEQLDARYNRPPPTVRTRISHKSTGTHTSKKSGSNIRSKSYNMEEDLDYNIEDTEDGYDDDGNERDGGALAYQQHNKAPQRKRVSREFEDELDYEDTFRSRNQGRINGEKRRGSKGGKKSTSGGNKHGKRTGGGMRRDSLPF